MLAYDIKHILAVVPEALPLVKEASIEQDYPTDCRASTIASVLRIDYLTKVAGEVPPYDEWMKVNKAAKLYGVENEIAPLREKIASHSFMQLNKSASEFDLKTQEGMIEASLDGTPNLEKVAAAAADLIDRHGDSVESEVVRQYAGQGILNKEAALGALAARYQATDNMEYIKIASIVRRHDTADFKPADIRRFCQAVTELDKQAHLDLKGFNIYKEAVAKEAAAPSLITVKLAGQNVPYETIHRIGKDRIASVIGKDVADAMTDDIVSNKQVLETLPLDLQRMLLSIAKNY